MLVVRRRAQPRVHLLEAEAAAPRAVVVVAVQVQHPPTGAGAGGGEQALREAGAHDDHVELLGELGGLHFPGPRVAEFGGGEEQRTIKANQKAGILKKVREKDIQLR